ncbi:hypothetical protein [Bacillus toyonensis]|uniref:hypothetical protein n=1 Tax=Bacillus toyonensis TaxID=155322 RepID=UPI002E249D3D|nr:hypothetical protein [Bacillus toyonensis]
MNGIIEMVRKIEQVDSKLKEWFILMDTYQDEVYKLDITVGKEQLTAFGYEKGKKEVYQLLVNDFHSRIKGALEERENLIQTLKFRLTKEMKKVDEVYTNIDAISDSELTEMFKNELTEKIVLLNNLANFVIEDIGKQIDDVRNERIVKLKQEKKL